MEALDYEQIRRCLARLAHGGDLGDPALAAAQYTEDGFFDVSGLPPELNADGRVSGRRELTAMYAGLFESNAGQSRHWIGNSAITPTGDGASVQSYFFIVRVGHAPDAGLLLTGTYDDRFVKGPDGEWRISGRVCVMDPRPEHRDGAPSDLFITLLDRSRPAHQQLSEILKENA